MDFEFEKFKLWELHYLIIQKEILSKMGLNSSLDYDENRIYQIVNEAYKKETGKELNIYNDGEKFFLYDWLKEKTRYDVLNNIIVAMLQMFSYYVTVDETTVKFTDSFVIKNILSLIKVIEEEEKNNYENLFNEQIQLPKITDVKRHELIKEYLINVDPSLEWLNLYKELIKNNKIIYLDEYSLEEKNKLFAKFKVPDINSKNFTYRFNNDIYIFITRDFTLNDFISVIHEFTHYVSMNKNVSNTCQLILNETFSIFYEFNALLFLENKGYNLEELKSLGLGRIKNTTSLFINCSSIFDYIKMYLENGSITEEMDTDKSKEETEQFLKVCNDMGKNLNNMNPNVLDEILNYKKRAYNKCDTVIINFVINPYDFHKKCGYMIGKYLAKQAIGEIKNGRSILKQMKYFTENLENINPFDVFVFLGCDTKKLGLLPLNEEEKTRRKVKPN